MVHLIVLRSCKNYVYSNNSTYGTHQIIERNISQRKYPLNGVRKGYNTPFGTEYHLMDYRVKKEIVPEFVRDLHAINLNPSSNNITLLQIFTKNNPKYQEASVGKLFLIIQWIFKWINKKKLTCFILTFLGIMLIQFWLLILALIIYINPLKPVPVAACGKIENFKNGNWSYDFVIGTLNDSGEEIKDEYKKETYFQEDIL